MSKIIYFSTSDYERFNESLTEEHKEILGEDTVIEKGNIKDLKGLLNIDRLQLDIETNFVDFITEREITLVQFGTYDGGIQYILDIPRLSKEELKILKEILSSKTIEFYIHNAKFEYTVIKQVWKIDLKKIKDTYILGKLLNNGLTLPKGYNSLRGIVFREFGYNLDKGAQLSFDGTELDYSQLLYGALDVVFLSAIHDIYYEDITIWKMRNLYTLECNTVRALGDMEVNGMLLDIEYHKNNIKDYVKNLATSRKEILTLIYEKEEVKEFLREKKFIQRHDEYLFKWTSSKVTKSVLGLVYPEISTTNKTEIKKLLKNDESLSMKQIQVLSMYVDKGYEWVESYLISNYSKELNDLGLFVKKGEFLLNLDSPVQRLELFKFWYPDLKDTKEKTLRRKKEPVVVAYKNYVKTAKLVSSFGEKMFDYVQKDGKIHTTFNQLVSTGRLSSSKPNQQQAPSNNKYRNAFVAREGRSFVILDYSAQEVLIMAQASKDEGLWYAIENELDTHGYSAAKVYGKKWFDLGGELEPKHKPDTKELNNLRTAAKSTTFLIAYGGSALSLSERLEISHKEAIQLLEDYFAAFPQLKKYMDKQNAFGKKKNFSRGLPPFNRVRFYNPPIGQGELNAIGRQSQNQPIQSGGADITKYAMVLIKSYIERHNLQDDVELTITIHDEIICEVVDEFAEDWFKIQKKIMEKAADKIIPGGWLKAEGSISKKWQK